ncbi:MAG: zinc ribbon domain-containing protein [Labilithrix sp.]|nr:zinc ribbon domain-containing protein [Labilithrix sp.]MCW5837968.1 zinc ribbon domain-containing protein [Labilithrix sp.]
MPTYEYVCTDCANHWEEIQKISEDPIQVCPQCGNSTAKRQISGGNFILKGGGWYADLYASTPKKKGDSKSETTAGKSESAAAATKSDGASSSSSSASSGTSSSGASSGGASSSASSSGSSTSSK